VTSTKVGSSYKEEVVRYIHSYPNGLFTDDRIGVTNAIADAISSRGLPVSVATVSTSLSALRKEGRVTVTYGHRSLDNKLLITSVTVHSEPHQGVALAPHDPIDLRGPLPHEVSNDPVFVMLRRLVRLMKNQPSLGADEIERFQLHVDHLIAENQEWEAIAQETEDGLVELSDDLRRQLEESRQRCQDDLAKEIGRSATLRERAERYRVSLEQTRSELTDTISRTEDENRTLHTENEELHHTVESLNQRVSALQGESARQRDVIARLNDLARKIDHVRGEREKYLVESEMFPTQRFLKDLFDTFQAINSRRGRIVIDNEVLLKMGVIDETGEDAGFINSGSRAYEQVLDAIAQKGGVLVLSNRRRGLRGRLEFARQVSSQLDELVEKVPPLRDIKDSVTEPVE
jgi:hypothetical protein